MATTDYRIRPARGIEDAPAQYALWLRATESLPRPWRSCLRNVEQQLRRLGDYPRGRFYAERADASLAGYIGTHPPFEWISSQHGPPVVSLGWAIPFGFPWTHPEDDALAAALYDELIRAIPDVYAECQRDLYIQRFRESWTKQVAFVTDRGWKLHDRLPLLGRSIAREQSPPKGLAHVETSDLALVADLATRDETTIAQPSADELQSKLDGGWLVDDTFWGLGDRGAFAIEHRGEWAGVTLFFARPDAWNETLQAASAQAASLGASELYFTVESKEEKRREALEAQGFKEVDAGVYYIRDAH